VHHTTVHRRSTGSSAPSPPSSTAAIADGCLIIQRPGPTAQRLPSTVSSTRRPPAANRPPSASHPDARDPSAGKDELDGHDRPISSFAPFAHLAGDSSPSMTSNARPTPPTPAAAPASRARIQPTLSRTRSIRSDPDEAAATPSSRPCQTHLQHPDPASIQHPAPRSTHLRLPQHDPSQRTRSPWSSAHPTSDAPSAAPPPEPAARSSTSTSQRTHHRRPPRLLCPSTDPSPIKFGRQTHLQQVGVPSDPPSSIHLPAAMVHPYLPPRSTAKPQISTTLQTIKNHQWQTKIHPDGEGHRYIDRKTLRKQIQTESLGRLARESSNRGRLGRFELFLCAI
ncbi:hypothetical protein ACLOJK_021319, partial [Asimina triloba]